MTATMKEIRKVVDIKASAETVFRALTDPAELTQWFPDAAEFEPKVGAKSRFTFYKDSNRRNKERETDKVSSGRVLDMVKNKKLAYTWQPEGVPDFPETIVTWDLESLGDNRTRVTLTHRGFTGKEPSSVSYEGHNQGWSFFVEELVKYCEKK
jgi:uncharacterized protein YndB with AHSA1/START domain